MSNLYTGFRRFPDEQTRCCCAERLLATRKSLASLRAEHSDDALLPATWNIRDFGANKLNPGPRLPESFYDLAEMASCFDLIAMQQVNRNLNDLEHLTAILDAGWDYLLTDATEGTSGNRERMAFMFPRDKVRFHKIAGEIVLPKGFTVMPTNQVKPPPTTVPDVGEHAGDGEGGEHTGEGTEAASDLQYARTPFMVAFEAGWFRFNLCTVHIYFGSESRAELMRRVGGIANLVDIFAKRQNSENHDLANPEGAQHYILLCDFNVVSPQHETMTALTSRGVTIPEQIDATHLPPDHFYDQIAVRAKDPRFNTTDGGDVDMYQDVFRDRDVDTYRAQIPAAVHGVTDLDRFRKWRTWHMPDHNPFGPRPRSTMQSPTSPRRPFTSADLARVEPVRCQLPALHFRRPRAPDPPLCDTRRRGADNINQRLSSLLPTARHQAADPEAKTTQRWDLAPGRGAEAEQRSRSFLNMFLVGTAPGERNAKPWQIHSK